MHKSDPRERCGLERKAHDKELAVQAVRRAVQWYVARLPKNRSVPFYCNPACVGGFAVAPAKLAAGDASALFRLLVGLSMYQGIRDAVVMRHQRSLSRSAIESVADMRAVGSATARHKCSSFHDDASFQSSCSVAKRVALVDCDKHPGSPCHVKDATRAFKRMGDMANLPTSAWLSYWKDDGVRTLLERVCDAETANQTRIAVGRSVPAGTPGRPRSSRRCLVERALGARTSAGADLDGIRRDGNDLVVVVTDVRARAVDTLSPPSTGQDLDARAQWVRDVAGAIDLREVRRDLPLTSPRLVQEALYTFCSKSNRLAAGDSCATQAIRCDACAPELCPFSGNWA